MLMPLKRFDERGKKRHKAFGADAVSGMPDQEQRVLDFWSVTARSGVLSCKLHFFRMVEEPHRVLTIISSRCDKGIRSVRFCDRDASRYRGTAWWSNARLA
jgi:hypothetical protein